MKIQLKSLTMVNFMGEANRTTIFNLDAPTTIAGANGLGKSRHFEAFMWLLFGKDSADRKDYEIKSIVNGAPLQKCECSVAGELVVDGEIITIKRSFVEQWVKPRGCSEQIFKGNQTECTWNGVPVKVGEFQKRINAIINDDIFKMLTNPLFFATMDWKIQREQLFQLAGKIEPTDIAKDNPAFMALLDRINGKSMADFKKELAFKKSRLKAELDTIQPKIDQTHALMPEAADFAAIEREIAEIDAAIAECDRQIADVTASVRAAYQAEQNKINQVNGIRRQMADIENAMKSASADAAFKANESRRALEREIQSAERELSSLEREHASIKRTLEGQDETIITARLTKSRIEKEVDDFRNVVRAEKRRKYDGSTTCPVCGQELPADKIAEAQSKFNQSQADKIAEMVKRGQGMNAEIARQDEIITRTESERAATIGELNAAAERITAKTAEITDMKARFAAMPVVAPLAVDPEGNPEWVKLRTQADEIERTINNDVNATADTSAMTERKASLNARRNAAVATLANRDTIQRCNQSIADLETQGKKLAQAIADIEKEEFVIQEFTAANINECERRINGLFHNVTFRLFNFTIDGNASETCIPLVEGVPFGRANTAGRINAGLDIINALCRHYNTYAPIFLDNAESVNQFIETNGQVIMMRVTTDPELIIK